MLSREDAIGYSTAGAGAAGSRVQYDVRRANPPVVLSLALDFDIPVRFNGDVMDRYDIRMEECARVCARLSVAHIKATTGQKINSDKPRVCAAEGRHERVRLTAVWKTPKVNSATTSPPAAANPDRYHVRAPSFINPDPAGQNVPGA